MVSGSAPVFRRHGEGYDRAQVDEYVAWVDAELRAQRRATDELVRRYQDCAADLELSRRLLEHSAEGQRFLDVTQQAGHLLAAAADQAAEVAAAGAAEAHRVVAEARIQAQASLDRARVLREKVLALCESMRRQAQQDRAEARETLARARTAADELLADVSPPAR